MEFFSRFRRAAPPGDGHSDIALAATLPEVNQRITVWMDGHAPTPSRVEDLTDDAMVLASPNLPLTAGDVVCVSWEGAGGWYTLETQVDAVEDHARPPSVTVSAAGRLSRRADRRAEQRVAASVPLEIRAVMARVLKTGQVLTTQTVEVGVGALRFATSSPLAPGDVLEVRMQLDGSVVGARVRVIRMDAVSGSWRQTCSAVYDEILASDRERIADFVERTRQGAELTLHEFGR